jgi:hypothetical protein
MPAISPPVNFFGGSGIASIIGSAVPIVSLRHRRKADEAMSDGKGVLSANDREVSRLLRANELLYPEYTRAKELAR